MGTWGYGIRQDDFVCDVISAFEDLLKGGSTVADATNAVQSKFSTELEDRDDEPLFWIAIADAQWTYGQLDVHVLSRIKNDLDSGRTLVRWEDDRSGQSRRNAVLDKFIKKIGIPNSRPKKPSQAVIRSPKYRPGECLSICLPNGQYGAALVLVADHTNVEYGKNLIGVIDYLSLEKPTIGVFVERKWLVRTHHEWQRQIDLAWYLHPGFRSAKNRLEVVGQVEILKSDPTDSNSYCGWHSIGEQVIMQREWDSKAS